MSKMRHKAKNLYFNKIFLCQNKKEKTLGQKNACNGNKMEVIIYLLTDV